MESLVPVDPSELIRRARAGEVEVLDELISHYRPYLKLLARLHRKPELASKLDDSDMVQETSARAAQNFAEFRGTTEAEFAAWLRTSMARVAAQSLRHFRQQRRDVQLERDLINSIDESSRRLAGELQQTREASPSEQVARRERAVLVAAALEELPENYREIIILRDFEGLTFEESGRRTGRSGPAARQLWARAVFMLRDKLKGRV